MKRLALCLLLLTSCSPFHQQPIPIQFNLTIVVTNQPTIQPVQQHWFADPTPLPYWTNYWTNIGKWGWQSDPMPMWQTNLNMFTNNSKVWLLNEEHGSSW